MHAQLAILVVCLLVALAAPSWGAGKGSTKTKAPGKTTVVTAPVAPAPTISPSGYVRDPSKPMAMRQYNREMLKKQKEAASNRAAARARLAKPGTAAPQPNEGGTK
jgi:hypothetical protein